MILVILIDNANVFQSNIALTQKNIFLKTQKFFKAILLEEKNTKKTKNCFATLKSMKKTCFFHEKNKNNHNPLTLRKFIFSNNHRKHKYTPNRGRFFHVLVRDVLVRDFPNTSKNLMIFDDFPNT